MDGMRFGVMIGGHMSRITVDGFAARGRDLEARGFDTMWIPQVFGHDAITLAAIVGRETERIELGTAVVPTYPRHPTSIAQQALSAAAASKGRFTLGIGLSHPPVVEHMLGLSYARRASHMREYLGVLAPILRGETAKFQGDEYRVEMTVEVEDAFPVPIVLAALGPRMLELAARETTGTLLWMTGFSAIENFVIPTIRGAAEAAGRPAPRIIAGMHIALTSDAAAGHARIAELLQQYRMMPSYRANIEREGSDAPADFSLIGDEKTLDEGLERLRDMGVSDFDANILDFEDGCRDRTLAYLEDRIARR